MDDPEFSLLNALESHKIALMNRKEKVSAMLLTIDKTILKLKENKMLTDEELYNGLSQEKAAAYRQEAIEKYGKDVVAASENYLRTLTKDELAKLKIESENIRQNLLQVINEDPSSVKVQQEIARHYQNIRAFWGSASSADPQYEAYKGLGELYVNDERFTIINGIPNPEFSIFLHKAMSYFADTKLK